ncbi:ribbon-helix-helix domain-containing protein [Haloterrigena hispanica]|uniref:Ribbon-helix-helix protein, copG family n=1 Tax=Natrinema hispanicum TaxID=392421 RepID=A0A1G6RTS5_9EURY|nr:Ribbon-helix-helix protein, copG family [Natrinema hispanicum]
MTFKFNTKEQEQPFKSFRLTISNEILIESIEELRRETGKSDSDIMKEALIRYLEEEEKIVRS